MRLLLKKTLILFGFENCLSSEVISLKESYVRISYSGRRYRVSEKNLQKIDSLVEEVLSRVEELSIAWLTCNQSCNSIYREITSLADVTLPIIYFESLEDRNQKIFKMLENVDRIIVVGRDVKDLDCDKIESIETSYELNDECWNKLDQLISSN